jgi:hypothetical protein
MYLALGLEPVTPESWSKNALALSAILPSVHAGRILYLI